MKSQSPTPQEKNIMLPSIAKFLILLSCVVVLSLSVSADNCDDVKANLTLGKPSVMTMGCTFPSLASYQVNATSSSTGAITMGGNNVVLDCNGSTLGGNGTGYGISRNSFWSNLTIKNCNISNYQYGAYFSGSNENITFMNNHVKANYSGYFHALPKGDKIFNNTFEALATTSVYGILLERKTEPETTVSNVNISSNFIFGMETGIRLDYNTSFVLIENNRIDAISGFGVATRRLSQNNIIRFNNVTNTWDAFRINSMYNNITDNYGYNITHNFLDTDAGLHEYGYVKGLNFLRNYGRKIGSAGAWISNTSSSNYINNTFLDCEGICIQSSGNSSNLLIQKNIMNLSTGTRCIQIDSNSALGIINSINFTNNTFLNCNNIDFRLSTSDSSYKNALLNVYSNSYTDNPIRIDTSADITNYTFIENTNSYVFLNQSNIDAEVYFNYEGLKNFTQQNYILTINGCNGGNCSAFWTHNSTVAFNNLATATLTIPTNGNLEVKISSASGGCDYPYDNYTSIRNTTFCAGSFLCIDENADGCIKIGASNIIITSDGAYVYGNYSTNSYGIYNNGYSNVTIKNMNLSKFTYGIFTGATSHTNKLINNSLSNSRGVYSFSNNFLNISGNNFYNSSIYIAGAKNTTIENNSITCFDTCGLRQDAIYLENAINAKVMFNTWTGSRLGLNLNLNNWNATISNNYIYNNDRGIKINNYVNDTPILIQNNIFRNNTAGYDGYALALSATSSKNIIFNLNYIYEIPTAAILIRNCTSSINLTNNYFYTIPLSERTLYNRNSDDIEEIPSTIMVKATYKGYLGDSTESSTDTIAKLNQYVSSGVFIQNNYFDENTESYLALEGASNITHDLSDYWYRKFQPATYRFPVREYYFNNNFDVIQNYFYYNTQYGLPYISNQMFIGYRTGGYNHPERNFNYSISKTTLYFKNVNQTTAYNLSLHNLTDQGYPYVDIFYSNQTTPVASDVNEWNGTIAAGNRTIVLNYATDTQPRISQLSQDVDTISITTTSDTTTVTCTGSGFNITNLNYHGLSYYVYHNGIYVETATNNTYIAPSCSSWEFTTNLRKISEVSPASDIIMKSILATLIAIIIMVMMGYPVYKNREDWEVSDWIKWMVISLIVLLFGIIIIQNIFAI